jgi:hypothetical protein
MSSGMCVFVVGQVVSDVSQDSVSYSLRVKQTKKKCMGNSPKKIVTSGKTLFFSNPPVRNLNLAAVG